ncbi:MAG TPA: ferritin-like domain-containing protein, partial [candidate division Zixibacteria bacterium]|nr:ferritin-like domain-containing protein [candidate division Zixibacteria bacterium]
VLREALAPEIQDELSHAKYLCDVIVDLGGEPTTAAVGFEKPDDVQDMLDLNIKTELDDEAHYTMLAGLAGADGLVELKLKLEGMAADDAAHARQWRRMRKT